MKPLSALAKEAERLAREEHDVRGQLAPEVSEGTNIEATRRQHEVAVADGGELYAEIVDHPQANAEMMRLYRELVGARFGLPAAEWMLEIGAFFLRTETELILKSRRVVPTKLLRSGFTFRFPTWPEAARDLCHRSRHANDVTESLFGPRLVNGRP